MIYKYLIPNTGMFPPEIQMFYDVVIALNGYATSTDQNINRRLIFSGEEAYRKFEDSFPNLLPYIMDEPYEMPLVRPDDNGIRPAGKPDECIYCSQKVGQPHKPHCVILDRKVKVRYSFDIEIFVPWEWDKKMIEFHRNESTWCADNALTEIENNPQTKDGCLCQVFTCEVLEIPNVPPILSLREDTHENVEGIDMLLGDNSGIDDIQY